MAMTLRLTPEQDRALTLLAEAQGSSKHEAAVRAILSSASRLLNDAAVAQLAHDLIPGRAALEARLRQARG
ncbi:CopG family transcriptional regulator [Corynebacterium atrinae]|uniref:CopG family transcriptional regulator n=1 Tax=Corynebacterium atrinae TaxID=1336740 RepID=UPI0025B3F360|nr:CopG family transcriptional regulator [Corynebacterium atrinae]